MKKPTISNQRGRPASDMTPEELREELEYLRAENAVLKKLEALLREKTARTKKKR
jgi:transposase